MNVVALLAILVFSSPVYSQSGRRTTETKVPVPPPVAEVNEAKPKPADEDSAPVAADRNQDYRCSDEGSLARILDQEDIEELAVSAKDADVRAEITTRPRPSYTREARRNSIQGFVTLKVLLSARGKVARVRVVKGLRFGLTENAIRAACKLEFKPAMKNGQAVGQWLAVEYVFRLADSSILSP